MSLVRSARLNGHDPYAYLRYVLERLPTQPVSRIGVTPATLGAVDRDLNVGDGDEGAFRFDW